MRTLNGLATLTGLFVATTCFAQGSDAEASEAIQSIVARYEAVASSHLQLRNTEDPDVSWDSLVFGDGEFVVSHWQAREEGSDPQLTHLVHVSDGMIRATHGRPRFVEGEIEEEYLNVPGPVHHWTNPWPLLDDWCLAIESDPEHTASIDDGMLHLRSDAIGLYLTFGPSGECVSVETVQQDIRARIAFVDYSAESGTLAPTGMRREFYIDPSNPDVAKVDEWRVVGMTLRTASDTEEPVWDPDNFGVYRFDPVSRNIYASDGSVLYNEDEWAANALGMSRNSLFSRRWLAPGLLVLAAVSGALAYWRWRR